MKNMHFSRENTYKIRGFSQNGGKLRERFFIKVEFRRFPGIILVLSSMNNQEHLFYLYFIRVYPLYKSVYAP